MANKRATIVIVHGAWVGGWRWRNVADLLRDRGHYVFTPTLTGLGERAHLTTRDVNLSLHAQDIANVIRYEELDNILLVGHSYGGAVIGGAARGHSRVQALVYLNAFVPEQGETILDLAGHAGPVDPSALFDMAPFPGDHNVDLYLQPGAFAGGFVNGLPEDLAAIFFAKQRPITYAALSEPARPQAWKTLPSWYVAGTEDHSIPFETQLWMAERAGSTLTTVTTGHLSMAGEPETVARIITEAANATK